jgi:asparaginyl-tRNA synthetase
MKDVLEVQQAIAEAARRSLVRQGFLEIIAPVVAPATDPGLRGAKRFEVDFYGHRYKLTSSMMLHKITAASALRTVFSFSPCLRKESPDSAKTGRHLAEFWQIDVELQGDRDDAMRTAETMLADVIRDVTDKKKDAMERLGRKLRVPMLPLKRITHAEAVRIAKSMGFIIKECEEIPWDAERAIADRFGEPIFIVEYPTGSRGFYDATDSSRPGKLTSFDLIYPEGFGEALSGSKRECDVGLVVKRLKEAGEEPEEYDWFISLLKTGKVKQTAGFGFGLERLTRFICGLGHIADATPFPKIPGRLSI